MDYMIWYERCLGLARIKYNGGELSAFEKSELEKNISNDRNDSDDIYARNVDILPA